MVPNPLGLDVLDAMRWYRHLHHRGKLWPRLLRERRSYAITPPDEVLSNIEDDAIGCTKGKRSLPVHSDFGHSFV